MTESIVFFISHVELTQNTYEWIHVYSYVTIFSKKVTGGIFDEN
jgi:hypothetical protein